MTEIVDLANFVKWHNRNIESIPSRVEIIEDFICGMHYKEIMLKHEISKDYLYRTMKLYYHKPAFCLTLQSTV